MLNAVIVISQVLRNISLIASFLLVIITLCICLLLTNTELKTLAYTSITLFCMFLTTGYLTKYLEFFKGK